MHTLIAAPFGGTNLVLRPGSPKAIRVGSGKFSEISTSVAEQQAVPSWLASAAATQWGVDLHDSPAAETILIRSAGPYQFSRATVELNLGCDYDCVMCYLGEKRFESLPLADWRKVMELLRDAGVIWLQLTGGEPLVDPHFPEVYAYAYELGMQLEILSNGSRLHKDHVRRLLVERPPYKMSLSVYGATEETYDTVTRNHGAFGRFRQGVDAAIAAGLNIDLSLIIVRENEHEVDAMREWAKSLGLPFREYANISPTIHGTAEPLPSQSPQHLTNRAPFTGCPAGVTFFHVNPFGKASICKVGREPNIDLLAEGVEGLSRLGDIAESLMLRTGGCSGCKLSDSCRVCRPMAKVFQQAKAPLHHYCQHGSR